MQRAIILSDIANKLKMCRLQSGMSRAEVSRKIGVHDHTLRNWEQGEHDIPLGKALLLCDLYGITLSELVGEPVQDSTEITQLLEVLEAGIAALKRRQSDS